MSHEFRVDPDIRRAATLPGTFYREPSVFERQKERVFARSWQLVPGAEQAAEPGAVLPFTLLEGSLDEPLLLTRLEDGRLCCLSNVCTHRANRVVDAPGNCKALRCGYHGRRFALDGRFLGMPEFEQAENFPSRTDDLPALPVETWGPCVFTGLAPETPFAEWFAPVVARVGWLPLDRMRFDARTSRDYAVRANWALYCDNYLEGFHIPFVHEGLAGELDYGEYTTETFNHVNLQIGIARDDAPAFELPSSHSDHGKQVAAYYFFVFPNLMLNFYPWGLSVNLVEPQAVDRTRVRFLSYVLDPALRDEGAGADLHGVELEDEVVVESCQAGVRSRLYDRGRYSPTRETGVHHFHRLLARFLEAE